MSSLRQPLARIRRKVWFAKHRSAFIEESQEPRRPALLVDLSVIARHDARTGIQRAVRGIWHELSHRAHAMYDFVPVCAGAAHGYCYARTDPISGRLTASTEVVRCRPGDKFLGLDLSAHYLPHCIEQLGAWKMANVGIYHVVYDLLPLQRPTWFMPATSKHFVKWFETIRRFSDALLCISDAVASDVKRELHGCNPPRVERIFLSGDITGTAPSRGMDDDIVGMLQTVGERDTVLMVGTVEPRKGYEDALAAFEWLWRMRPESAPNLIIVGKPGWQTGRLQHSIRRHFLSEKRLYWRENVSDEALTALYDHCSAVLVSSLGEGFGLPLSEAAFHGKWVLARDLPVFREQKLSNCLYFADDSPRSLGRSIIDLLEHAQKGPPPAAPLPDWDECLRRLLSSIGIEPGQLSDGIGENVAGNTPSVE